MEGPVPVRFRQVQTSRSGKRQRSRRFKSFRYGSTGHARCDVTLTSLSTLGERKERGSRVVGGLVTPRVRDEGLLNGTVQFWGR